MKEEYEGVEYGGRLYDGGIWSRNTGGRIWGRNMKEEYKGEIWRRKIGSGGTSGRASGSL